MGEGKSRLTPRRIQRGWLTSRGGSEESRSRTWWGGETGVRVRAHGGGWGQRESRRVSGPRYTGAGRAPRHAGAALARSSPRTDLDNPSGARIGGRWGAAVVVGIRPGGRVGPSSSGSSRDGQRHHVRRQGGCVAAGGPALGRGVAHQLWTAHPRGPPQNIPIRASTGMSCPNLREIGSRRGRGVSPVVFPTPLLLV